MGSPRVRHRCTHALTRRGRLPCVCTCYPNAAAVFKALQAELNAKAGVGPAVEIVELDKSDGYASNFEVLLKAMKAAAAKDVRWRVRVETTVPPPTVAGLRTADRVHGRAWKGGSGREAHRKVGGIREDQRLHESGCLARSQHANVCQGQRRHHQCPVCQCTLRAPAA